MLNVQRPSARLIGGALVGVMVLGSAMGAEAATKKKSALGLDRIASLW